MDFGGFNWSLLIIVGPIVLLAVIAWAMLRNRRSPGADARTEAATHNLYDQEERERLHGGDKGP